MDKDLKYPIGKPIIPPNITQVLIAEWIHIIENFPNHLENLVKCLSENQLNTTYREQGWTIKQVIHHCADSHLNSYIRFKWALTENEPTIEPYYEDRWAELFDSKDADITISLNLLKSLHTKWVYLMKGLTEVELNRVFIHPSGTKIVTLKENIGIYAWHCNHHYAHISNLVTSKKWNS
ncbi:YfiT family bacillithiol transferase [Lutibacter sp.]|uniref:YfiT family bacillithiol transferase n=1 Tax=Lutibacter sp. TaxID=1925666 RepID=UPI002732DD8B|nr:putative metal-dependent hydrolase [Lutibacter sp.]MDP3312092.1 putative metal-dependent hydrolase [Lutibacter sp.]